MSCKDKDGGTHHFACECREAYVRRLEAVARAVEDYKSERTTDTWDRLVRKLASLKADVK